MRSICRPLFCGLAVFFFVLYVIQNNPHVYPPNGEFLVSLVLTGLIFALAYGLYKLLRQIFLSKTTWRILYICLALVIAGVAASLYFSSPEIRQLLSDLKDGFSTDGQRPIVYVVLCLIICGVLCVEPARQSSP